MEGGEGEGFPYGNFQRNLPFLPPRPPLTAIDRFLWDQNHYSRQEILTNFKNKETTLIPTNVNSDFPFSSSGGAINGLARGGSQMTLPHEPSFRDGFFINEQTPKWSQEINPDVGFGDVDENLGENFPERKGKRQKGGSSVNLIKGQWTDDEDSTLKKLVNHYGVKKWAQIAEKMVGRAGKQCRERWHNHLRPDIKKDTWSEEEELLLVEAHMQVGNRWAEIAKRIPGRTENSIKNHWNATKRRQNSRRKGNKPEGQNRKNQSTILQDYIKSTTSSNDDSSNTTPATSTTTNTTPPNSGVSEDPLSGHFNLLYPELSQSTSDDSPSYLAQHSYDDEMNFMQNFFGNNSNTDPSSFVDNAKGKAPLEIKPTFGMNGNKMDHTIPTSSFNPFGFSSSSTNNAEYQGFGGNMEQYGFFPSLAEPKNFPTTKNNPQEENQTAHLYSDLYFSHLLDAANALASPKSYPGSMNMDMTRDQVQAAGYSVRKEMDLVEMVSNFQFSRGNASNSLLF